VQRVIKLKNLERENVYLRKKAHSIHSKTSPAEPQDARDLRPDQGDRQPETRSSFRGKRDWKSQSRARSITPIAPRSSRFLSGLAETL
jgi:hypothetical protein